MRVAWLADSFEVPGGAELTQAEFRAVAPAGVEVVAVQPDALDRIAACDCACVHNSVTYPAADTIAALEQKPVLRYWHDLARDGGPGEPALNHWVAAHATSVFTSPLHRDRFPHPVGGESFRIPAGRCAQSIGPAGQHVERDRRDPRGRA